MGRIKLCFIFDETGDYKPVPHSRLMDGNERREEFADRYFIPLNGYLLEVSQEDYLEHYRSVNRKNYIRKEAKRVGEVSLQTSAPDTEVSRELYEDVAEQVIEDLEFIIEDMKNDPDPQRQAVYNLIPRKGEKPTVEEFLEHLTQMALMMVEE